MFRAHFQRSLDCYTLVAGLVLLVTVISAGTAAAQAGQTGSVAGRVVAAEVDSALAGALVSIEGFQISRQTDAAGNFRFTEVTPGKHVILARRIGYAPLRRTIRVRAGAETTVDLVLQPEA